MTAVHWHKDAAGGGTPKWYAEQALRVDPASKRSQLIRVAEAAMTGRSGVDNYPWDWYLTDAGKERAYSLLPRVSMQKLKTSGVADTLASVKDKVRSLLELED